MGEARSIRGAETENESGAVFNLIDEPWLPVRRRSGAVEHIQPWRVTENIAEDPFVAFEWPRPDFNGAAHELLIGLLSTAAAPADDDMWGDWWWEPPAPDILRECFAPVARAFNLDGPGPRFLQDLDPFESSVDAGKKMNVAALLINAPGAQTLRFNADLFVKRNAAAVFCRAAAAIALFTLNTYAPRGVATGGRGHRQSLRKAGPLTTLIAARNEYLGNTLWGRLWPNVESNERIEQRSSDAFPRADLERIFLWLAETRTSENGRETTPGDVHTLHAYWGMPRRIRLVFEDASDTSCTLMGVQDAFMVQSFNIKPYGTNYSKSFEHPLTPYFRKKPNGVWEPSSPDREAIGYRHWPAIQWGDHLRRPAQVIRDCSERSIGSDSQTRIVAFGYYGAIRSVWKARAWIEGEMPLLRMDDETRELVGDFIRRATGGANTVAGRVTGSVKSALYDQPSKASGDFGFIAERFYRDTEGAFYTVLGDAVSAIRNHPDSDDPTMEVRKRWAPVMERAALRLFDEYAPSDGLEDRDMHRHVKARFDLALALRGYGKTGKFLFETDLGIPSAKTSRSQRRERGTT